MARYGKVAQKFVKEAIHTLQPKNLKRVARKQAIAIGLAEPRKSGVRAARKKAA